MPSYLIEVERKLSKSEKIIFFWNNKESAVEDLTLEINLAQRVFLETYLSIH